jgi:hypothetical protein
MAWANPRCVAAAVLVADREETEKIVRGREWHGDGLMVDDDDDRTVWCRREAGGEAIRRARPFLRHPPPPLRSHKQTNQAGIDSAGVQIEVS